MDYRVQTVIALMKKHLQQGSSANSWASHVNLSPSRLHQVFKEETGLPPARYLRQLRMEQARELLETSHLSVKEVMARVGVADKSHFVRDFKKAYGCAPAKYRMQFLRARLGMGTRSETRRPGILSAPMPAADLVPRHPSSPVATARVLPPLLLRRPSHPRHLKREEASVLQAKKKREFAQLLFLRHLVFAEMTTTITAGIAAGAMLRRRSIFYRPRMSTVSRRLPPAAHAAHARPCRPARQETPAFAARQASLNPGGARPARLSSAKSRAVKTANEL